MAVVEVNLLLSDVVSNYINAMRLPLAREVFSRYFILWYQCRFLSAGGPLVCKFARETTAHLIPATKAASPSYEPIEKYYF